MEERSGNAGRLDESRRGGNFEKITAAHDKVLSEVRDEG
jgi:hypothetical protein